MTAPLRIAVIGAGIVGAALALALARRGAEVTVIDAGGARASENSLGWINASWFNRPEYFRLRHHSMAVWRRWEESVPGLAPRWSGGLLWELAPPQLEAFVEGHAAMGYDIRLVARDEIRRLEPALADPPERAALAAGEGWIDAGPAAAAIRAAAGAAGARLLHATAEAVEPGAVRLAGGETVAADRIVVAAGAGTADLLGLPVTPVPGLMILTAPAASRVTRILTAPDLMVRPDDAGRLLAGAEAGGSALDRGSGAIADELVDRVRALLGAPDLALERIVIGQRPMPADDEPLVGPVPDQGSDQGSGPPGVYAAVMHSGVTLAPGVAELVAEEVIDGADAPLLAPFRPGRAMP